MHEFKSISERKRLAIQEALTEWGKEEDINTTEGREQFETRMFDRGWKNIGVGAYKVCLAKGSIVLKYVSRVTHEESLNEISREFEQWKCTPYKFKKHLTRTYTFVNGLLIQDKVLNECCCSMSCIGVYHISREYPNINDCYNNHGHSLRGKVKFFDWVYNRTSYLIRNPDRKLIEK